MEIGVRGLSEMAGLFFDFEAIQMTHSVLEYLM